MVTYQCYQTLSASQLITITDNSNSNPKEVPLGGAPRGSCQEGRDFRRFQYKSWDPKVGSATMQRLVADPPQTRSGFDEGVISEGGARRALGGVPREQKMLEGHLPRVIYHQLY